ncbi:ion channel [Salegentibacter sp. 24]|uniref:potassium channel family protein n=1 Tax=Salegentibacter sp. 24 TaxID=2183986 RepID=UPI00106049E2|nr:potassium channel family protein [Salegentibacter sp. 24]TDN94944.1 ion channel [Salegentibacter sp. 24]
MDVIIGIIGLTLLVLVFGDFFFTTLSFNGYGQMSKKLNQWVGALIIHNNKSSLRYVYSGISHLLINSAVWLGFLILSAWIIFMANEEMVINSSTREAADILERLYFTCYVISTVGLGDFIPGTQLSRIIFTIISFSGFIMLTLNITYLSSVIQAVKKQKALALQIDLIGKTPDEITDTLISERNIDSDLIQIKSLLTEHIIDHFSFPVIHRFISRNDSRCPVVQCLRLYVAIAGYQSSKEPEQIGLGYKRLSQSLKDYLEMDRNVTKKMASPNLSQLHTPDFLSPGETRKITMALMSIGKNWENIYTNKNERS